MPLDRPVLLISDRPDRAERLAQALSRVLPVRILPRGSRLPAAQPVAWVVDIDLERSVGTAWFAELSGRLHGETASLYISRGGGAREHALLALLGSPGTVPAKLSPSGIVAVLTEAIDDARLRAASTPVERKLGTAIGIVGNVFTSAAQGGAPSPIEADQGTEIVLDAISEIGIRSWLELVWRHDITVYQHSLSVAGYAAAFAGELGFSRADRHRLAKAALLHDVGKSRIPLAILDKPGPLTPAESETMRTHAAIGADLLAADGRFEQDVVDVARGHHERLDGSGYPDRLTGAAIGDLVRLVAICDVHSALTERRVYRPALSPPEARAVLDGMAGQLDADLLRAFRPVIARAELAV